MFFALRASKKNTIKSFLSKQGYTKDGKRKVKNQTTCNVCGPGYTLQLLVLRNQFFKMSWAILQQYVRNAMGSMFERPLVGPNTTWRGPPHDVARTWRTGRGVARTWPRFASLDFNATLHTLHCMHCGNDTPSTAILIVSSQVGGTGRKAFSIKHMC